MEQGTNGTLLSLLLLHVAIVADSLNNVYMGKRDKGKNPFLHGINVRILTVPFNGAFTF
jgi:hypothetical protein